ncbi:MAG: phosphatase PAP2 family protein [Actinomycetota bacterium]
MRFPMPVLSIMSLAVVVLIFIDLSLGGLMIEVDVLVDRLPGPFLSPYDYPVADWLDRLGQATVAGIPMLVVTVVVARRLGSVRPFVLTWSIWAIMYGFVGVVKLVTLRESPRTGGPALFESGTLFPSGHTSNVVFMFGMTAVLLVRYVGVAKWQRTMLTAAVPLAFLFMSVVSVYRHTHWLSDIVVGGLIGLIALELCVRCDTCWPSVRRRLQRLSGRHHAVTERSVQRLRTVILGHPVPNGSPVPGRVVTDHRPLRYPYRATAPRAWSPAPTRHATAPGGTSSPTPEPPGPDGDRASARSRRG